VVFGNRRWATVFIGLPGYMRDGRKFEGGMRDHKGSAGVGKLAGRAEILFIFVRETGCKTIKIRLTT